MTGRGFGLDNLPYGVDSAGHVVVALGDDVVDLAVLDGLDVERRVWESGSLNAFLALGPDAWARTRAQLQDRLAPGQGLFSPWREEPAAVRPRHSVELVLAWEVTDYVDFYSSEHHAANMGRLLRPDHPQLPPAWRHLPIGYHGRAGTVVVGGTDITRPCGLLAGGDPGASGSEPANAGGPEHHPTLVATRRLDLEAEVGFVVGAGSTRGVPVTAERAGEHVFGAVVVNDWSARDIQAFEYQPLGPFLAKSFATSVSPWVVPLAALAPYAVAGPAQQPPPAPHLLAPEPRNFDIRLELSVNGRVLSCVNAATLYWSMAQQVAHLTSNGASMRTGDLFATGTISGPEPGSVGSLMEMSGGEDRWLADGDTVSIRGWCGPRDGGVSFGEVTGTILPARPREVR